MSNTDSSKISKIYQQSENERIVLNGLNLEKIRNDALKNPEAFWSEQARNLIWSRQWDTILDWSPPFARWFTGGRLNASVNCLDRHIGSGKKNKAAIIWEDEEGRSRTLTYYQLYILVNKFANSLKQLGIRKGDRVTIYLPSVPELPVAMLACARIGATHTVVFSGFSSQALYDRINDSQSKLVITADGGIRRGKLIELKKIVDEAIPSTSSVQKVIVLKRAANPVHMGPNDIWWHEMMNNAKTYCEPEQVESTHPLFILYTSGTTGKPKGVIHSTGGYLTYLYSTAKWVFDFKDQDIFFCTADIGWVTGHSYLVYAPLMHGVTEIIYDGAPDYPRPDKYWDIVDKHGATILYTTPTAIRMYMKYGDQIPNSFDMSTLRLLGSVGEPINPDVWKWYFRTIGKERCPIIDTWWQTETGGIMISACSALDNIPMKPGSGTFPIPGIDIGVVDDSGNQVPSDMKGYLVVRNPWPGMLIGLWNDDEKYKNTYWSKFRDYYYAGDYARRDSDGYMWLLGRSDDVLKVAGHRLGTMEIESALVSHPSVAEAAVASKQDEKKGEAIIAFVVLKTGISHDAKLQESLVNQIRTSVGPIASPEQIIFVNKLPKTRSGKIMRRLLKSIACGSTIGDLTTIEDGTSVEEIQQAISDLNHPIKK